MNNWSLKAGIHAVIAVCIALLAPPAPAPELSGHVEFALVGDPQIGYGSGAEYADAARFRLVADDIAKRGLEFTVIAGDLVQDRSLWQHWAYARVARRLPGTVVLVPGNHDIVDLASLSAWRDRHGPDYRDVVWHDIAFLLLNSETLRDQRISSAENAAQWMFLERRLAAHRSAGRAHIVLAMHRPPFVRNEGEPEGDVNWPLESRAKLLSLARAHGVRLILAGHLHRTTSVATLDGIQIVVGAGSARSFDQSPIAWHRIRLERDSFRIDQIVVAPPPRVPFAVPGLAGWTPRLFDFSVRHWLFTLLHGAVGLMALALARRRSSRWFPVAILSLAIAANMQLDIDELLGEIGRLAARLTGVYAMRHVITGSAAILVACGALLLFARNWRGTRERLPLIALGLMAPPIAWFGLSTISNRYWGMFFNEGWWDLLTLASTLGVIACGAIAWRQPLSSRSI